MHVALVGFFAIIANILGLAVLLTVLPDRDRTGLKVGTVLSMLGLGLWTWITVASWQPAEVLREFEVKPTTIKNYDGTSTQVISYVNRDGNKVFKNCNAIFSGILPENAAVLVKEYRTYYYCGLSFDIVEDSTENKGSTSRTKYSIFNPKDRSQP